MAELRRRGYGVAQGLAAVGKHNQDLQSRAQRAEQDLDTLIDCLCGHFFDQDHASYSWLRERALAHLSAYRKKQFSKVSGAAIVSTGPVKIEEM